MNFNKVQEIFGIIKCVKDINSLFNNNIEKAIKERKANKLKNEHLLYHNTMYV